MEALKLLALAFAMAAAGEFGRKVAQDAYPDIKRDFTASPVFFVFWCPIKRLRQRAEMAEAESALLRAENGRLREALRVEERRLHDAKLVARLLATAGQIETNVGRCRPPPRR